MQLKSDYQAKIQNIAKMLPEEKLGEILDFMEFLKGISPAKALFSELIC